MAKSRGVTWQQLVEMATAFPGVETKSAYGTPGLYVGEQFMSRLREPDVIVLKPVEDDEQRFLMETPPEAFFLTDHYRGYPTILVRLSKVQRGQLAELVAQCWRRLAPRKLLAGARGAVGCRLGFDSEEDGSEEVRLVAVRQYSSLRSE